MTVFLLACNTEDFDHVLDNLRTTQPICLQRVTSKDHISTLLRKLEDTPASLICDVSRGNQELEALKKVVAEQLPTTQFQVVGRRTGKSIAPGKTSKHPTVTPKNYEVHYAQSVGLGAMQLIQKKLNLTVPPPRATAKPSIPNLLAVDAAEGQRFPERKTPRRPPSFSVKATVTKQDEKQRYYFRVRDISLHGMFLYAKPHFEHGFSVGQSLTIRITAGQRAFELKANVMRICNGSDVESQLFPLGIGVRFEDDAIAAELNVWI